MPRKLKVFEARFGFFDSVVAVPSQAAALVAWGAHANLFHDGGAKPATDEAAIAAATAQPGVPLRRAAGSDDAFSLTPRLPRLPDLPNRPPRRQEAETGLEHGRDEAPLKQADRSAAVAPAQRSTNNAKVAPEPRGGAKAAPEPKPAPVPKPVPKPPPPSRAALDAAEQALADLEAARDTETAAFVARRDALATEERTAAKRHAAVRAEADTRIRRARDAYRKAGGKG